MCWLLSRSVALAITGVVAGSAGVLTVATDVGSATGGVLTVAVGVGVTTAGVPTVATGVGSATAGVLIVAVVVESATVGVLTVAVVGSVTGALAVAAVQRSEIMLSPVTATLMSVEPAVTFCPVTSTSWPRCGFRSTVLFVILKV